MTGLVEKTLGEFLSDLVAGVAVGMFLLFLIQPIKTSSGAKLPLHFGPDTGYLAYANWVFPLLFFYVVGKVMIYAGATLIALTGKGMFRWREPVEIARKLAHPDSLPLLNLHLRLTYGYDLLAGIFFTGVAAWMSLLFSLMNPANRNPELAAAISVSSAMVIFSGFAAFMALRRMQQTCKAD